VILGDEPRQDGQEDEKKDGPKEDRAALKELDILVIITLYVHGDDPYTKLTKVSIILAGSLLSIFFCERYHDPRER
jgi:hypothetical protein